MTIGWSRALLALAAPATPPGTQADPRGEMMKMLGMFLIMGFIFYFIAIRPQRTRQKQLDAMLQSLKPKDKIVTNAGIIGIVVAVKDKSVSIRSADTTLEILKSSISEVTERASASVPASVPA